MIAGKKVLALIPARGGSKGLPRKNIMPLGGKPLISWSITHGLESRFVDAVVVSTDAEEIAEVAKQSGARVPFIRPSSLASDEASSIDVIMHAIDALAESGEQYDLVALLEPTSPLREASDIDGAIEALMAAPMAESIVGVADVESVHPSFLFRRNSRGFLAPYLERGANGLRRQDLDPLLFIEGSIYVSHVVALRERCGFYHDATIGWHVPRYKSLEIDELPDLIAAEALLIARQQGRIK